MQYLVRYFSSNGFTYSLDVPGDETGDDSNIAMVGSFLKRKSGYCAHYASAFAILGRALGVPTRMVLGYSTSGVVDENGSYSVSAKQLHAWDEAYPSGVGWVPFDVTPAASEESSDAGQSPSSAASSSSPSESSSPSASQSASPSASASASSSGSIGGPSSRTQGRDGASQTGLPVRQWMVFLVAVAGLGALRCVPMGIRSRRRRRWLRAFDRAACGGADDDTPVRSAWIGAWRELQDTAWDCGARWPATATDRDIADVVGAALACEAAGKVAGRAAACVFGHGDVPAPSLKDAADVRAAVEGRRRFMPMSLFRRR
ncbi:transglutaminase-like domain-containing protein [Bifidobacterium thermacidophilum]|uniref:transglutaminase-like domain-containing protein n=1 Tax=Bifidobacterium thermacidophilum TaxID=246618 RepID=UPI00138E18D4|nr:transglutaminase-like domain-containing protein [Bifidobacterium thermacidophilum]